MPHGRPSVLLGRRRSIVGRRANLSPAVLVLTLLTGRAPRASVEVPVHLGVSASVPTGSPAIAADGLVAAYDMSTRNADGTLRDFSGHGHDGDVQGTTATPGVFGDAMRFATPSDRVHLPELRNLAIEGPLSILVWLRVDTAGLHQHLIACDDEFSLWLTEQDDLRFVDTVGDGAVTKEPVARGRWHSAAAVFTATRGAPLDDDDLRIYVDGARVPVDVVGEPRLWPVPHTTVVAVVHWLGLHPTPHWNAAGLYPHNACYIGFESHQGDPRHQPLRFAGAIDDVLLFRRALDEDEIRIHAAAPARE
jgi:hypothetical protein